MGGICAAGWHPIRGLDDHNTGEAGRQQGASLDGDPESGLGRPPGRAAGTAAPRNRRSLRIYEGVGREPLPRSVAGSVVRGAKVGGSATPS